MPHEFLHVLSRKEKVAVSGLSPAAYEAIVLSKKAGYSSVTAINLNASAKFDVGALLLRLEVAELEQLSESLKLTLEADRVAGLDLAKAVELYRKALQLNPFDAVAAMSCGVALAKLGNFQEGLKWLEQANDLTPGDPRIERNLGAIRSYL
jgi:tetratricopeptide (TPR) repeat protein